MDIHEVVERLLSGNQMTLADIDTIANSIETNRQLIDWSIDSDPYAWIALDEFLESDHERYDLMSSLKPRYGEIGALRLTCLFGGLNLDANRIDLVVELLDWFFHIYFADPYLGHNLHNLVIELGTVSKYVPSSDEPPEWQSLDIGKFSRLRVSSRVKWFFRQQQLRAPNVEQQDVVFNILRSWSDYRTYILSIDALYDRDEQERRIQQFHSVAIHMSVNDEFQTSANALREKYDLVSSNLDIKWEFHPSPLWVLGRSAKIIQFENIVPLLVDIYVHLCRDFAGWNWRTHHGLIIAGLVFGIDAEIVTDDDKWKGISRIAEFIDPNMFLNVQVDDSHKLASAMLTIAYITQNSTSLNELPSEISAWITDARKLSELLNDVEPASAIRLLSGSPDEWYSPPKRLTLEITDETTQNAIRKLFWSFIELNRAFYVTNALADSSEGIEALYRKNKEQFKRDRTLYKIYTSKELKNIKKRRKRLDKTLINYDDEQDKEYFTLMTPSGKRFVPDHSRKHLEVIIRRYKSAFDDA